MGSSKKVTVGYKYYLGLHFGLCHGPVDSLHKVVIGERDVWVGEQSASGSLAINVPELFGGDKREGGVVGTLDVMMGESTQVENSYLQSKLGAAIPAFRGILSAVWRGGQVTANNPYLKPWAFRVKRILQGWSTGSAWYPEKAEILHETNPCFPISQETVVAVGSTWDYRVVSYSDTSSYIGNMAASAAAPFANQLPHPYDEPPFLQSGGTVISRIDTLWMEKTVSCSTGAVINVFVKSDNDQTVFINWIQVSPASVSGFVSSYSFVATASSFVITIKVIEDQPFNDIPGNYKYADAYIIQSAPEIGDMNPAHIIYQCLTDTDWGMGYPTSAIDSASFAIAADALYTEGFGLSMLWNQQETIEQFISIVLDHIGGILYVRPDAGTFALKLVRADYDRETLPIYGTANLISAESYQRQAWGETVNEITVVYTSTCTGKDESATVQDLANIVVQGGVVAQVRNYPGIRKASLAQRVALRDLQAGSTPLASIKLTATRAAWQVFPGDVFRLTWPEYGIDDVVYRALNVNRGTLTDGKIIIDAVEDVFGLPDNTYLVEQPGGWVDPSNAPAAAPYRKMIEVPYWDLVRTLSAADMAYVDSLAGYLETAAMRPSGDATNYAIKAKVGAADYSEIGNGDFCPTATIVPALTKTTTALTIANGIDLDLVEVGGYAIIDDEYVLISAIDAIALTATISRGVLDTVPAEHAAGARIWFADSYTGFSTTEYADGETVDVKLLPLTGQGELDISLAPVDSLTMDQRQYRPYPPGKVRFDTLEWPAIIEGATDVVLTWAHRDRLSQTAYIVEQDEASIGPESSVTYSVEVTDDALSVLHSATGISGATATVPASSLTDGLLRFRLWAVRGGLDSWQIHEHWAIWGDVRVTEDGESRITEGGEYRATD